MPEIQIRPVQPADLSPLIQLDHSGLTDHVWQMSIQDEAGKVGVQFRELRLPRPVLVTYPRRPQLLADVWQDQPGILVASVRGPDQDTRPIGYLYLAEGEDRTGRVAGCAVHPDLRRKGIGMALVVAAQDLAVQHSFEQFVLETHAKNYPAIQLARKLGLEFYGYQDRYFPNGEIALFFGKKL